MAIFYPWNLTSLLIALAVTYISVVPLVIILYLILRANNKLPLLIILLAIFILGQVFWSIWAAITFFMFV